MSPPPMALIRVPPTRTQNCRGKSLKVAWAWEKSDGMRHLPGVSGLSGLYTSRHREERERQSAQRRGLPSVREPGMCPCVSVRKPRSTHKEWGMRLARPRTLPGYRNRHPQGLQIGGAGVILRCQDLDPRISYKCHRGSKGRRECEETSLSSSSWPWCSCAAA